MERHPKHRVDIGERQCTEQLDASKSSMFIHFEWVFPIFHPQVPQTWSVPTASPDFLCSTSICPVQAATVFQGCMPRERRRRSRQRGACHWGNLLVDVFFFDKRGHGGSPSHIGFNTKSLKSLKSCSNDWDDLGIPLSLSKPPYSVQTEFCTKPARVSI